MEASWTFSATGHDKGPCDDLGAVAKSSATQYLLRGSAKVSSSSAKELFECCFKEK